ncbi:MAG TPA: HVA1 family protein [Nevskiaceae bacterium]|nr:HVA1 family protein [Nevskiaceae bacterium]
MTAPSLATVFTIGHSNRPIGDFIALLEQAGIQRLVDIRRLPGSRAFPQFDSPTLEAALHAARLDYSWLGESLGGRRGRSLPKDDLRNGLWENQSFRYYADYALSPAFTAGLAELEALAAQQRCAIMCAEAVWWRCHRRIVTDHLIARDHPVFHIMGPGAAHPASLTPGAVVCDGTVTYPPRPLTRTADLFQASTRKNSAAPPHFAVGDHVRWNSEAGYVTGRIIAIHTVDTDYKGHLRRCTQADPQYSIKSDKTDHIAMHKGKALKLIED